MPVDNFNITTASVLPSKFSELEVGTVEKVIKAYTINEVFIMKGPSYF